MKCRTLGLRDLTNKYRKYVAQAKKNIVIYHLAAAFKCINYGSQVLQLAIPTPHFCVIFITLHLFLYFIFSLPPPTLEAKK